MDMVFSESAYEDMLQRLFNRFPSFQKDGASAYKPGIANMEFADQLMGHPHRNYRIIHVAGTNGKGSVSNMMASALAATDLRVGLYTSPHIVDFRERIRVIDDACRLIPKEDVWDFVMQWRETFDHVDLSFFEITTLMALDWFARQKVDIVVLETGLGGRLDSTNIVTPVLSVITNIGLDHCDLLGDTLPEIAFEKAGIIKPEVPVVVGESNPEIDVVFERKVLYTNISSLKFMGDRNAVMSLLKFADKTEPALWEMHEELLDRMDLKGSYQRHNLRTALTALQVLGISPDPQAIAATAARTGFHGRWERLSDSPLTICDIGHNGHGLKYNFSQLEKLRREDGYSPLIIVYGSVADKDVDAVIRLMPADAVYVFTKAAGKRAMDAEAVRDRYLAFCAEEGRSAGEVYCAGTVIDAVEKAYGLADAASTTDPSACPIIYIGGSTYVVSEAVACLNER